MGKSKLPSGFWTNKTEAELDAMTDEEYFVEVLRGTPPNKSGHWWRRKCRKKLDSKGLNNLYENIYKQCKKGQ